MSAPPHSTGSQVQICNNRFAPAELWPVSKGTGKSVLVVVVPDVTWLSFYLICTVFF